jgi:hypothetical protein
VIGPVNLDVLYDVEDLMASAAGSRNLDLLPAVKFTELAWEWYHVIEGTEQS